MNYTKRFRHLVSVLKKFQKRFFLGVLRKEEIQGKFPSSGMIHKIAGALQIDPTELFYKEIDPETANRNTQKAVIEDIGEAVNQLITDFFEEKVKKLDEEIGEEQ